MELLELLERAPVLRIPPSGPLARQAARAAVDGLVLRPLPRIVMSPGVQADPSAWVLANWLWRPSSVVTGRAALRLQGLPDLAAPVVDALLPYELRDRGRLRFHNCRLPGELKLDTEHGSMASTAASALFLGSRGDWAPICDAIREDKVTPEAMTRARELLRHHPDARLMDKTLRYISESPWSVAELELHELLRIAGIKGWKGNLPVFLPVLEDGVQTIRKRHPDAAFEAEKLGVEVASEQYHNNARAFAEDARRTRWFAAAGWTLLPVTPKQLRRNPNDFLHDLCCRLYRPHRPSALPLVVYQAYAPFWRCTNSFRNL